MRTIIEHRAEAFIVIETTPAGSAWLRDTFERDFLEKTHPLVEAVRAYPNACLGQSAIDYLCEHPYLADAVARAAA